MRCASDETLLHHFVQKASRGMHWDAPGLNGTTCAHLGKSAALILRRICPRRMEEARALYDAETLQLLRGWSMRDATLPASSLPADIR